MHFRILNLFVFFLLVIVMGTFAGCSGTKKCGCGSDLNKAYVPKKYNRR